MAGRGRTTRAARAVFLVPGIGTDRTSSRIVASARGSLGYGRRARGGRRPRCGAGLDQESGVPQVEGGPGRTLRGGDRAEGGPTSRIVKIRRNLGRDATDVVLRARAPPTGTVGLGGLGSFGAAGAAAVRAAGVAFRVGRRSRPRGDRGRPRGDPRFGDVSGGLDMGRGLLATAASGRAHPGSHLRRGARPRRGRYRACRKDRRQGDPEASAMCEGGVQGSAPKGKFDPDVVVDS
jgi:hypothetical protein